MPAISLKDPLFNKTNLITPIQVMFFDTDVGGVVHNIAYLRFVETTRTLLAVQLGLDWKWMQEKLIFPVILKTEIDYHTPAFLGDNLEVHVDLGKATGVRFWCHFKITRPSDEALIVSGQQALAFVKTPEGKPLRLPKNFPTPFILILAGIDRIASTRRLDKPSEAIAKKENFSKQSNNNQ